MIALLPRCFARYHRAVVLLLLVLLVWLLLSPSLVSSLAGFGGYISEKLLGDDTNEALYLGDGANELVVLGSGPVISTGVASSSSAGNIVSMTMTGHLQDLNGMPRADVWFAWGYTPTAIVYTTPVSTVTAVGEQTAVINPHAGDDVYYQFRASTDGTSRGETRMLSVVGGGHGVGYWLMNTLLPVVIASAILILVLTLTGNIVAALLASVIGLAAYYIITAIVSTF